MLGIKKYTHSGLLKPNCGLLLIIGYIVIEYGDYLYNHDIQFVYYPQKANQRWDNTNMDQ